ncbi:MULTISPECIES: squalene/phytoene synthase family protein [Dyella]|uniref:Phytoene synthase n=2 Tax=Dyella TaxID=231454 RepID=A0A4R0YZK3_9GAMM|nr:MULTISPECIES: squalene/phytoene synthase family protein [Dyella]TBR39921.1 phytoene synthase [Dyella terrae]TCI12498.1 phytoene synthase [Dyella soli]
MSAAQDQAGPLQSYIDKWLAVQPRQRVALAFVDASQLPGHIALAAWEQELLSAAYGIREPHVAAVKLNWWAEELAGAAASGGRHPLTQVLFDDERAHAIPTQQWLAPVLAAMAQIEEGTAADFASQVTAGSQLHGALADLETAWWYGASASSERSARIATLSHVLFSLLHLEDDAERDRLPLPMSRMARFGLSRQDLRQPGTARDQAIRAQLVDLAQAWKAVDSLPGPLSVFRALESKGGQAAVRSALGSDQPLKALTLGQVRTGPAVAWQAWRAARQWKKQGG